EAALRSGPVTKALTHGGSGSFQEVGAIEYWQLGRLAYISGRVKAVAAVSVPADGDVVNQTIATINGPFGATVTWRPIAAQPLTSLDGGRVANTRIVYTGGATQIILNAVGGSGNIAVDDVISFA